MRYKSQIKSNGYLKASAAMQDVPSYDETQEALALLKILALGNREIDEGKVKPIADVVNRLRAKKTGA